MKTTILAAGAAFVTADGLGPAPPYAHHSFAMFDSSQHRLIEGVVTRVELQQPA